MKGWDNFVFLRCLVVVSRPRLSSEAGVFFVLLIWAGWLTTFTRYNLACGCPRVTHPPLTPTPLALMRVADSGVGRPGHAVKIEASKQAVALLVACHVSVPLQGSQPRAVAVHGGHAAGAGKGAGV